MKPEKKRIDLEFQPCFFPLLHYQVCVYLVVVSEKEALVRQLSTLSDPALTSGPESETEEKKSIR